ncbi:hypothetical protein [Massilia consociata]|uniref:Uncharacterized protein n=1 Tax=Massilia consociata TaxID=760117 RepID=A0ABV6FLS0_9BURK
MNPERRSKPRPILDSSHTGMSNAELDAAIRELNRKVEVLMAERRSRRGAANMQSDPPKEPENP